MKINARNKLATFFYIFTGMFLGIGFEHMSQKTDTYVGYFVTAIVTMIFAGFIDLLNEELENDKKT